jgi:hypothetical protein
MSQYRLELATPADDADLRHILADTPMAGRISVSFRREPSYFAGSVVDGRFRQVVAARESATGRLIGFGSRSISQRYVNGRPEPIGYLSSLRLLPKHRNRGLLARGYAFFRKLHADGLAPLYLTTIAEGNETALGLLTSGRAGLPAYHFAGHYHTLAIPLHRCARPRPRAGPSSNGHRDGPQIRPARVEDLPVVLDFLHRVGSARQFFPCLRQDDFSSDEGGFRGLPLNHLLLAFRDGNLVGTLAAWDQQAFRQTVVHGYARPLNWCRPVYNAWAGIWGRPILPKPGQPFRHLVAALPVVAEDNPEIFAALLLALLAIPGAGAYPYLLLGFHESDPLLTIARHYRSTWYTTRLYLVCWEDGEPQRSRLESRPPYLELGTL